MCGRRNNKTIHNCKQTYLKLQIKTLQNAPRDKAKLERLLKVKEERQKEEAMHMEDTQKG
jgi:hypothetical protein